MKKLIKELLKNIIFVEEGATLEELTDLDELGLPKDYLSIFSEKNGGEGFIGDEYLILWKAEELKEFNKEYEVNKYAPGIFLFGSNGGGEAYGFDMRNKFYSIVKIPFVGMDLQYVTFIAPNFVDFLKKMNLNE